MGHLSIFFSVGSVSIISFSNVSILFILFFSLVEVFEAYFSNFLVNVLWELPMIKYRQFTGDNFLAQDDRKLLLYLTQIFVT